MRWIYIYFHVYNKRCCLYICLEFRKILRNGLSLASCENEVTRVATDRFVSIDELEKGIGTKCEITWELGPIFAIVVVKCGIVVFEQHDPLMSTWPSPLDNHRVSYVFAPILFAPITELNRDRSIDLVTWIAKLCPLAHNRVMLQRLRLHLPTHAGSYLNGVCLLAYESRLLYSKYSRYSMRTRFEINILWSKVR